MNRGGTLRADSYDMGRPGANARGGRASVGLSRSKQRVGGLAVVRDLRVVRPDPGDFGFELADPRGQLVLRISVETFLRQQAGGIAANARKVVVVHCAAASQCEALAVNIAAH